MEPAVDHRPLGHRRVSPIALHDELAALQDLAILAIRTSVFFSGGPTVSILMPARGVAADHRPALGLAYSPAARQPSDWKEDADFRVERRPARYHRLDAAAEALADLGPERAAENEVHRPVEQRRRAACTAWLRSRARGGAGNC
jgi:hypothetical protein